MSVTRTPKLLELKLDIAHVRASLVATEKIPEAERKAVARSINRALNGVRTDIVADLRSRTVLKAGTIRKGIFVMPVYWYSHKWARGYVKVATSRLPLTEYKVSPMRQTAQKRKLPSQYKRLSYILEPGGKKYDDSPHVDGRSKLFMLRGRKSGALKVFTRLGAERTPIVTNTGPSLQFFFGRSEAQEVIMHQADMRFRKELARNISHLVGGGK